jgi:hypothetical protein
LPALEYVVDGLGPDYRLVGPIEIHRMHDERVGLLAAQAPV